MLNVPVVGGNVSLYNESDEFGTRIIPTPSIGMAGKGALRAFEPPEEGNVLALLGETTPAFGGSILDTVSGCNGETPRIADPAVLETVRDLVNSGAVCAATDISHGGLLAALAYFSPNAEITLEGEALIDLFSESYGRFLLAFESAEQAESHGATILGVCSGEGLRIHTTNEELILSPAEIEHLLSSTTRLMQY
jgi:phosphoribosylformylglycinamidine synthase